MSNTPWVIAMAIGWTALLAFGYVRYVIGADSFLACPILGLTVSCFGFSMGWISYDKSQRGGGK